MRERDARPNRFPKRSNFFSFWRIEKSPTNSLSLAGTILYTTVQLWSFTAPTRGKRPPRGAKHARRTLNSPSRAIFFANPQH